MKRPRNAFFLVLALAVLSAGAWAQNSQSTTPPAAITAADVQSLKDALTAQQAEMAAQQAEIESLRDELHRKDQVAQQAQSVAADAAAKADAAQAQASQQMKAVSQLKNDVADLRSVNETSADNPTLKNAVLSLQESPQTSASDTPQTFDKQMEGPLTIHFRGINITPGGYVEAAFVRRSRELGADLPTPFNSLTMPGASQSTLPEFFGSARQSKITTFIDGRVGNVGLSSYVSADFLSAGVTSTATQTNSYTLRLRQAWGQVKFDNGWKFLGGQAWSLVTEDGVGISPDDDLGRTNDARPKVIDPGYNAGFTFARQYGLRLTKDFNQHISAAIAVENPQGTLTTTNNAANFLLGEAGASNSYNTTSNYTANPSPDIIAKVAFDQGPGHYEIFGLADRFTDRVFPCVEPGTNPICTGTAATGAYNASKEGGGFGFNLRWTVLDKHLVFGLHEFGGTGVGRYGAAQLSDISIHANGTLNLIRDYQGLGTLEYRGKKLSLYSYAGIEYAGRAYDFDPNPNAAGTGPVGYVGYGAPEFSNAGCYTEVAPGGNTGFAPGALAHCTAQTRAVLEGTLGFWYAFYSGPKGKFQFGTQYSYVTRETWSGVAGPGTSASPSGLDNMVFTSFRYYLP
ncbi:MAG: hypothetical protein WBW31_11695 [Candidatus Sulfotelmatobacter sp.]